MITVAGVVFSITLVALSLASSQYAPRVLRNFMSDRINQAVLGAFVGIFAYCLVVLRTIRGGDVGAFVPSLAVLVGLVLGFAGIAVLIYFIHHISNSIQASHILDVAAAETLRAVDHLFPDGVGEEDTVGGSEAIGAGQPWHPVAAAETGYVQSLDTTGLLAFASERRVIVRMERRIGQFVIEGVPLVSILGAAPDEDDRRRLKGLYAIGRQRTVEQDAAFGIRQIVDVALKALSPRINDTTTAVMCIDHLTAILLRLTVRRIESHYRGKDGALRLLTRGPTYADMVGEAFDQIRQNAGGNVMEYSRDDAYQVQILTQYTVSLDRSAGKIVRSLLSSVMFLERYRDLGRVEEFHGSWYVTLPPLTREGTAQVRTMTPHHQGLGTNRPAPRLGQAPRG